MMLRVVREANGVRYEAHLFEHEVQKIELVELPGAKIRVTLANGESFFSPELVTAFQEI
jgi:hypothetical protein